MEPLYGPAQVVAIIGCSKPALRNYAHNYAAYYSGAANPDFGQSRAYTANDVKLTSFIYTRSLAGYSHQSTLQALQAGELDNYAFTMPEPQQGATEAPSDATKGNAAMVAVTLNMIQANQQALADERAKNSQLERLVGELTGELRAIKAQNEAQKPRRRGWWVGLFGGE